MPDFWVVARRLLAAVEESAATLGFDLPARRYVTPGVSGGEAWDCEQVVVGAVSVNPGIASAAAGQLGALMRVPAGGVVIADITLRVEIVRDVPVMEDDGNPPDADDITNAAEAAFKDLAVLRDVVVRIQRDALLTDGVRATMLVSAITPTGPQGGLAGVALQIAVDVL